MGPDAREAIGLQLQSNGKRISFARIALLQPSDLLLDSQQLLDVMAELVGNHVCLREFAGRAEFLAQLIEEAQIDIDLFVFGTVERSGGRLCRAATRLRVVAEKHQLRVTVVCSFCSHVFCTSSSTKETNCTCLSSPASRLASPEYCRAGAEALPPPVNRFCLKTKLRTRRSEDPANSETAAAEASASAKPESAESTAAFPAPVFDI